MPTPVAHVVEAEQRTVAWRAENRILTMVRIYHGITHIEVEHCLNYPSQRRTVALWERGYPSISNKGAEFRMGLGFGKGWS